MHEWLPTDPVSTGEVLLEPRVAVAQTEGDDHLDRVLLQRDIRGKAIVLDVEFGDQDLDSPIGERGQESPVLVGIEPINEVCCQQVCLNPDGVDRNPSR